MRRFLFVIIPIALVVSLAGSFGSNSSAETESIKGDYVEVRTASVFAGACHYNGELTTAGRDALMAWSVKSGAWQGVDLAGVRAIAIVSASENLADKNAARNSEIIIGENASDAQSRAMLTALKSQYAASLGQISSIRRAPLSFDHQGKAYAVKVNSFASITVEAMPDDLCCKMPQLVWYSPLVPLENRKVGYTTKAIYAGGDVGEPWQRSGENSAFYGTFAF
ncbi:MAG TPA: DUF1326 domain-containing protein [Pyrinomonadaceae bacterium]|nr:DUF1326 domain-containing protein [Pyrinomonadaceae bacterium]